MPLLQALISRRIRPACRTASSGLLSTGIASAPAGIAFTTRAMEACASTTTSTPFISFINALLRIPSCVAVSPASTASNAPSHNELTISISLPAFAAFASSSSIVGSSVVFKVAITPILRPMATASSAIASSTRITGTSNSCCPSATAAPMDEHVTITASAPAASADSIMLNSLRIVTRRSHPVRIVSLIRLSSTMWNTVVSGICSAHNAPNSGVRVGLVWITASVCANAIISRLNLSVAALLSGTPSLLRATPPLVKDRCNSALELAFLCNFTQIKSAYRNPIRSASRERRHSPCPTEGHHPRIANSAASLYPESRIRNPRGLALLSLRRIAVPLLLLAAAATLPAQQQPSAPLLGTAWYPEQWPESRWDADLTLMEQAHMNVARVAEFAWSTLEPSDGHFDFTWLDHAIALAAKHHIAVVLGTPTAAPPAWLTTKYPQTLRLEEDGRRAEHGNRQQFSANDPKYRELAARIAHQMAVHYGHNPNILGWQIDNEIGAPTFDPSAVRQWHQWLAKKYVTVADLNQRWATAYWSQTYDTFDEIPFHSKGENPALLLDYKHFVTDTWTAYVQNQIDAIRPAVDAHQFITTNTMHWYSVYDHYTLHQNLDLAAWDDYVPDGKLDPALNAAQHDLVRGYKQKNFWVMETQPAFVNWGPVNASLPPGVTREMAWQAVGHGADAVLYWQWRSALNGQEQYHGSVLGPDGLPVPVYAEIQHLGEDFAKLTSTLAARHLSLAAFSPVSRVAMLQSYDSHWAIDFQKHTNKFDYVTSFLDFYRAISPIAQSIDILSPQADLTPYPIVFAPALNVLPEPVAKHLLAYVEGGGHLVLGPRSGMKNADDGLQPNRQPGPLESALGAQVNQFYALESPVMITGPAGSGKAAIWAEDLKPLTPATQTLLTYGEGNGWLTGHPAAVQRAFGEGSITYLGADLDPKLMSTFIAAQLDAASIKPILTGLPPGVELMERSTPDHHRLQIFLNHTNTPQSIHGTASGTNLLTGQPTAPTQLAPHDVALWLLAGPQ